MGKQHENERDRYRVTGHYELTNLLCVKSPVSNAKLSIKVSLTLHTTMQQFKNTSLCLSDGMRLMLILCLHFDRVSFKGT